MTLAARPLKIFVVDDHRDVAEGLADVLRMHGHEVEVAFNGEQAIRIFRERDFDIAFMDVMMPGMNGVESFMEIRKIKPAAKVIMMTGYSVAQLLDQAIDKGAYGVLHKPVSVDDVLEALNRVNSQGMVLVADDDPEFSAAIKDVIEDNGYRVCLASSGSEALKTVMGGGVDILVLDLHLPVISGLEVYMQLQKRNRAIPTVVVTGYSDEQSEAISTLQSVSKTGILTKPFDSTQLLWELGKLTPGRATAEEDGEQAETANQATGGDQAPDSATGQDAAAGVSTLGDAAPAAEQQPGAAEPALPETEPSDRPIEATPANEPMAPPQEPNDETVDPTPAEEPMSPPQPSEPVAEEAPAEPAAAAPAAGEPVAEPASTHPEPAIEPAAPEPASIPDPVQAEPAAQPCPGRILIVDDDVDMVEGLGEVVRTWGYEVETANTANQAKEIITEFDAQAALLDIRLGKDSGLDLIAVLKEHRPSIYCVMITGNADKESSIEAMRRGAHDYLIKPLDPDQVSTILERCLDRYNVEQRLNAAFDEIQDAKDAAERTSEGTSQLVARMSEELNKPIEAITEAAKALRVKAIAAGHTDYLAETGTIEAAASGVLELLGNTLYLAKAQADELALDEGEVTFVALASAAVAQARQLVDHAGPEVKVELPDDPLLLWGDAALLQRALVNLLTNAFKFTLETGSISLKAETAQDGRIVIVVRDTGIGMDPTSVPNALSQFGRVEDENCAGLQGAGLGLPLVAALVECHGGTLTLESEKGKGTAAIITLPSGRSVKAKTAA